MSANGTDENDASIVTDFLDEAGQLIDKLNEDLLILDELVRNAEGGVAQADQDLLNGMFRSAHSIKGLSAMLGFSNVNRLTHRIENVLDAARKEQLALTSEVVQSVFVGIDSLTLLTDRLRNDGTEDEDISGTLTAIQAVLSASGCEKKQTTQADAERALSDLAPSPVLPPVAPVPEAVSASLAEPAFVDPFADLSDETDIPTKYLGIFIDEAETSLDELSERLSANDISENPEHNEPLMITAHRIKGSAASLGLNRAAKLAHLLEDDLQELREKQVPPSPAMVEALLKSVDALRAFVVGLKQGHPETIGFSEAARELDVARHHVGSDPPEPNAMSTSAIPTPSIDAIAASVVPVQATSGDWCAALGLAQPYTGRMVAGRARFDPTMPLVTLKAQLFAEKIHLAGDVLRCQPPQDTLDSLDSIEFLAFAVRCDLALETMRSRLDVAGLRDLELIELSKGSSKEAGEAATTAATSAKPIASTVAKPAAETSHDNVKPAASEKSADNDAAKKQADNAKPTETLRVDIERLDELMNLAGQLVISRARFSRLSERIKETLPRKSVESSIADAATIADRLRGDLDAMSERHRSETEPLRAQMGRLVEELASIREEMTRISSLRNGVNDLFEAVHQLERVSDGIQKSVMDTRMVPIGPLFTRFKRVIRDITRSNGKDIELDIRGEKTELDKRMIDELSDPLIHMVRNSADHGIESREDRLKAGKAGQGTITLDAFHRGNHIIIQVSDDGKGLDRQRILNKAIERQLVTAADAERMTPQQIFALIWEPGFSTAEKITEISGRGMGMDIVRSKIEGLSGQVEVDSSPGHGTVFTIKLPLTMAILPSLMAEVEGDVFAMPLESIVEIVDLRHHQCNTVHGVHTATIRGRVVSVVELNDIFDWTQPSRKPGTTDSPDAILVVLVHEGREIGLRVDRVIGEEDVVIKSLAENYRNVEGVAGASILGDGRVSLILDTPKLIEMTSQSLQPA